MTKTTIMKCGLIEGEVYQTKNNGDLRVIEVRSSKEVDVEFVTTGYTVTTHAASIRNGDVKDKRLGFIEGNVYPTNKNGNLLIVKIHNYDSVDVEFVETGFTTTTGLGCIRSGSVKDKLRAPACGLVEGNVYPMNTSGDLRVIKIHNAKRVDVEFVDTGYTTTLQATNIHKGYARDKLRVSMCGVAYVGDGPHKTHDKDGKSHVYNIWSNLINRCYNSKATNYKMYGDKGITVCDEWLNFQTFATWYIDKHPTDDKKYQVSRTETSTGDLPNIFSPNTCQFNTQSKNLARHVRIGRPANVYDRYTNELIAEGVKLSVYAKDNGYSQGPLSDTTRADRSKPQSSSNRYFHKGVYAIFQDNL